MKTTIEIADPLLHEVRKVAAREGVTLRTLVERGLHHVVAQTKRRARSSCGVPASRERAAFGPARCILG